MSNLSTLPATDPRERVKQAIDPSAYKTYLPDLAKSGSKYIATCPFHADSHPSLSIENKRGAWVWYCHPCSVGGDLFELVKKKFTLEFPEALRRIANDLGIEDIAHERLKYDPATAQKALLDHVTALEYLSRRGISAATAKAAGLGLIEHFIGTAITIPYASGVVKVRALSPKAKGDKFRHLNGASATLLYGIENVDDDVFGIDEIHITESELDSLMMRQAGFKAVSVSSATTCLEEGELRIESAHLEILKKAEKVFLWTDQDEAGQKCAAAFEQILPAYKVFRMTWQYRGKDSGDPKDVGEIYTQSPENFRQTIHAMRDAAANRPRKWRALFKNRSQMDQSPMRFLIDRFLPEGTTFIGALSGSGKTWFCLSMAKAICTGQKFLGNFAVPEKANVLYLVPESSERSFRERMEAMGIPDDDSFLCRTMTDGAIKLTDPNLLEAVRILKPVVFLDTAVRFNESDNENDASQSAKYMADTVFALNSAGAKAVVCVHHSAKSASNKEASLENSLRGSGDLGAMSDAVYALKVENHECLKVQVKNVKARDFEPAPPFVIQGRPFIDETSDFGVIDTIHEPPFKKAQDERKEKFLAAITDNPDITYPELQEVLGSPGMKAVRRLALVSGWQKKRDSPWQPVSQTVN